MVSATEQYLFDVNGYFIVKNVLGPDEIDAINEEIDRLALDDESNRLPYGNYHAPLAGHKVFRDLMDHPRVLPYLESWVAPTPDSKARGVRLDHAYFVFTPPGKTGGANLHLGATPYVPPASYHVRDGRIQSALTVVSYVLSPVEPRKGGFGCIPGSHKANFPCPSQFETMADTTHVLSPPVEPGDVLIFTEALTHGTFSWLGSHQRRGLFFKYAPLHMAWMHPCWPAELLEECSDRQRAMLQPPQVQHAPLFFVDTHGGRSSTGG